MAFDFPATPALGQVFGNYIWDGEKWKLQGGQALGAVRYDTPQILSAGQQAQARDNIRIAKKNYIINGAMMISQENEAAAAGNNNYFPVDMFIATFSYGGLCNAQQYPTITPAGSPSRLRVTVITADTSMGAGEYYQVLHMIEGLRMVDLCCGTAAAKTVTLRFGLKAPAGTYSVAFRNYASNRSYVAECVIAAGEANTDVVRTITVPLDQTGVWNTNNTTGLIISWALLVGSTYQTATLNTWTASNLSASTNQSNFMSTVGNVFELFDVSLTEGSVAPPFQVPDYASELALCQRYYKHIAPEGAGICSTATMVYFGVRYGDMRAAPAVSANGVMTITDILTSTFTQSVANVIISTSDANAGLIGLGNFSGLTPGKVYVIQSTNKIKLNARL